ncbi:cellulase (glycosyl hydrolase family 5) domain-containing protein [Ditylenchus destructor]|nr:cellulase (glycosyl hydrolase family 5) domain-containing protein [Ditylenchus destructor]
MNFAVIIILLSIIGTCSALTPKAPPYGALSVKGSKLIGSNGNNVQLTGMSLYWSQWMGQYWTKDVVNALACKWNANLVRAAMGVQAEYGGYLANKATELAKVRTVVEAAIEAGIYVIIDWHDHEAASHKSDAIDFFKQMANDYGKYPHVLYELWNEPLQVDWNSVIKPYHQDVLAAIRAIDQDNVAILGTPDWSGSIDKAKASPLIGTNIMYTVHFYTGADASWQEFQRQRVAQYASEGFPLFATEYGVSKEDGGKTGGIYIEEANKWFSVLDQNKISYANWAVDDAPEASAALKPGTSPTQVGEDSVLTDSGKFIKAKLKSMSSGVSCLGSNPSPVTTTKAVTSKSTVTTKPAVTTKPPVTSPPSTGGSVTASVKVTNSWSGGAQIDINVTNNGNAQICGATLKIQKDSSTAVQSMWNLESSDGVNYLIPSWVKLSKGQTHTAGAVVNGNVPSFSVVSTKTC